MTGRKVCFTQDKMDSYFTRLRCIHWPFSADPNLKALSEAGVMIEEGVEGDGRGLEPGKQILQLVDNKQKV